MTERNQIAEAYNAGSEYEYARLRLGPLQEAEFELTADLLAEYLKPNSMTIDIGAGPGRYAEFLLEKGHKVGLVDISEKCLLDFSKRVGETFDESVLFTRLADATDLQGIESGSFDAALLMGPLYHLVEEAERAKAIAECRRVLKPNGYVFAAFISPYPRLVRLLEPDASRLCEQEYIRDLLERGLTYTSAGEHSMPQFRCWPKQAVQMMESGGFTTVRVRNLEGIASFLKDDEKEMLKDPETKAAYFSVVRRTCENPDLLGATLHFLYVGTKKR